MITMKPSELKDALETYWATDVPLFIHGSPGIGKSQMVMQFAAKKNVPMIDMRLSHMDEVDLRGIPYRQDNLTQWAASGELPTDEKIHGPVGILFLDELTSARKGMQAVAYQVVHDKKIGQVNILPGWRRWAAGNLVTDRAIVEPLSSALKSRFGHVELEPDVEEWRYWAMVNGFSDDVLGFISFRPTLLNDSASGDKLAKVNDRMAFATSRGWEMVDKVIKSEPKDHIEFKLYSGIVGEGAAAEFMGYMKHKRTMPNLDEILMSPDTSPVPEEPAVLYALATGLAAKATEDNFARVIKYVLRIAPEFQVLSLKDAVTRKRELCNTPAFTEWAIKNHHIIM